MSTCLAEYLPRLQPRFYSAASSPLVARQQFRIVFSVTELPDRVWNSQKRWVGGQVLGRVSEACSVSYQCPSVCQLSPSSPSPRSPITFNSPLNLPNPVPTPPLPLVPHFLSSPPLLLKARPGHWMVCRHVFLRTVPGGGWTATFSMETTCTSECYCDRATLHVQLSQTCHFLFEAPNYLVYCFCFSCLDRHFL